MALLGFCHTSALPSTKAASSEATIHNAPSPFPSAQTRKETCYGLLDRLPLSKLRSREAKEVCMIIFSITCCREIRGRIPPSQMCRNWCHRGLQTTGSSLTSKIAAFWPQGLMSMLRRQRCNSATIFPILEVHLFPLHQTFRWERTSHTPLVARWFSMDLSLFCMSCK